MIVKYVKKMAVLNYLLVTLGAAAVHIHGAGSSPKILRCKITECENVGLFISEGAQGTYEDNDICANRLAGIWVKSGANPIMKRNEVHHGKDAGFFIFDGGMVSSVHVNVFL